MTFSDSFLKTVHNLTKLDSFATNNKFLSRSLTKGEKYSPNFSVRTNKQSIKDSTISLFLLLHSKAILEINSLKKLLNSLRSLSSNMLNNFEMNTKQETRTILLLHVK